ncbi:MAG: (Fe-S)-binding protein [Syntrophomonadaceae bacterium]|nr:(Fe-S)-binding protein [Syntrophomonadaceae bacterium]
MRVSLFIPCTVDTILVNVGQDFANIMSDLGFKLNYHSEQTCCGQPVITAGYLREARKNAKKFIDIFADDEYIVGLSGSCIDTIKNEYVKILSDEPIWAERAQSLASRIYEFSQFMVDVAEIEDVAATYNGKVAYHDSCRNLRGLGIKEQPRRMLNAVKGIDLISLNDNTECCGFGGAFAIKYPYLSGAIVRDKVASFIDSEADVLVVSDPGCLLNIQGYLHRAYPEKKVKHIVSFLAENRERGKE